MNRLTAMAVCVGLLLASQASAVEGVPQGNVVQQVSGDQPNGSDEQYGTVSMNGIVMHQAMVDGIETDFMVISLAGKSTSAPAGKTHRLVASFLQDEKKITSLVGLIKLISPSGKEQIAELKDSGNGEFATYLTFNESGLWNVICVFKEEQGKHAVQFQYEHSGR